MSRNKSITNESLEETIARFKANQRKRETASHKTTLMIENTEQDSQTAQSQTTQRVSKNTKAVSPIERKNAANQIIKQLLFAELTQGQALKELRMSVLGLKQERYASLVGVSRKTLSDIENDRGNYKTDILNRVFRPFGLKVGIIPSSPNTLASLINEYQSD